MTTKIVQHEMLSHKVSRKLISTRHSDKEATATDFTEFTIAKTPEKLTISANFAFYSYITNTTSCNRTILWFI